MTHKRGFSAVTVKGIVTCAKYNRTTFYLYYQDKCDLVHELMQEMSNQIQYTSVSKYKQEKPMPTQQLTTSSFDLLYFIYDHRNYFSLLLSTDTLPHIHTQLPEALFQVLTEKFVMNYETPSVDDQDQKRYMAYGTAGIITDWIANDFKNAPAEITDKLIQIFQSFTTSFMIKSLI